MIKGHGYLDYPLKGDDYSQNSHLKEDIFPKTSLYNGIIKPQKVLGSV